METTEEIQQLIHELSSLIQILDKFPTLKDKAHEILLNMIHKALILGVDADILVQWLPDETLKNGRTSLGDLEELGIHPHLYS